MNDDGRSLPPDRLWQPTTAKWFAVIFGASLAYAVIHLVVLGVKGWLAPQGWHGGIPPVSLVAVVAALVPLLVRRKLVHDKKARAAGGAGDHE